MPQIQTFTLSVEESALEDLRKRLAATRWPERETVDDWSQGATLNDVRALCEYWRNDYSWRRCETMLNSFGQYRSTIDGLGIHFLHIRSPESNAMPLILTHGWPGSVIEFHKVIAPLTNPVAHGGDAGDAFHLVVPSLPGFGFSDKPQRRGWNLARIARAWICLMDRLGYQKYAAQGGDWGSAVTMAIGALHPPGCVGIHLNMPMAFPCEADMGDLTAEEKASLASSKVYREQGSGYAKQQSTRPQTLGYALADSPSGQAAWIYEKYCEWSDCDGSPYNVFSFDEMLDNIMLYWLPGAGASSARLYWESLADFGVGELTLPVACSIFPKELFRPSYRWAERKYRNIVYWNEVERGGHFAAFEQPLLFVEELRRGLRPLRGI
jgi:epoxide hydrolase